jgi:hypothetical protein
MFLLFFFSSLLLFFFSSFLLLSGDILMSHPPAYAAIGIYQPGQTKPSLMSVKGRIVVFDHPSQAADYLPLLGGGRVTQWVDGENVFWLPLDPRGTNRACILTDYDPHSLPPGMPVPSETRGKEWKGHVHAAYVFHDCGQMVQRADGSWANTALGEV